MRLRQAAGRDRRELAGIGAAALAAVGVAVIADALVAAAQAHRQAAELAWNDRLLLGLWTFRVEHALWFTIGAAALAWTIARGATLAGWAAPLARLAAGFCVGLMLVAAAVVLASTWVALAGRLGDGASAIHLSNRERSFTWLLQLVTALGAGTVWALLAGRLSVLAEQALAGQAGAGEEEPARPALAEPQVAATSAVAARAEGIASAPPPVVPSASGSAAQVPLDAVAPAGPRAARAAAAAQARSEAARPSPPPRQPQTLAGRAEALYRDVLAWSPQRVEARRLVEEVTSLERAGRSAEAEERIEALRRLGGLRPPR
jgi:hypothetical protein